MSRNPIVIGAWQCVFPAVEIVPAIGDLVSFEYDAGQGIVRVTGAISALRGAEAVTVNAGARTFSVPIACLTRERRGDV